MRKRLISSIILIAVVSIFVAAAIAITTNATITNEIAVNQLNGGDEAYIMQELYNKYRIVVPAVGAMLIILSAIPFIKTVYQIFIKNTKENNQ